MFLISKIVRGRRLLHELEQEEAIHNAAEIAAAAAASSLSVQLPRRSLGKTQQGSGSYDQQTSSTAMSTNTKSSTGTSETRRRCMNRSHSHSARCRRKSNQQPDELSELMSSCSEDDASNHGTVRTVRQSTESCKYDEMDVEGGQLTDSIQAMRRTSSWPTVLEELSLPSGSSTHRHYNYNGKLNKLQKRALRFTWHRLQTRNGGKRVESVFEEVFDRMVKQSQVLRDMFTTRAFLSAMSRSDVANLRDHSRIMVKMVDLIMKNLDVDNEKRQDTGSEYDPRLVGRAHASLRPYGLTGSYWEKLGERMIDVVLVQEAVRDLPGAGQAWVVLTACIVDQLRAGFEQARNSPSPQPSNIRNSPIDHDDNPNQDRRPSSARQNNTDDSTNCPSAGRPSRPNTTNMQCPMAIQSNVQVMGIR